MIKNSNIKIICKYMFCFIIIFFCFFYLKSKKTYTSYESNIDSNTTSSVAQWNIKINEKNISTVKNILIDDIVWNTEHTRSGKVSPGSTGTITLIVDPALTEVNIKYQLSIIDKSIDNNKLLTVNSVSSDLNNLIGINGVYTGFITFQDAINNKKDTITINVEWVDDDTNDDFNSGDEFIELNFKAIQYKS